MEINCISAEDGSLNMFSLLWSRDLDMFTLDIICTSIIACLIYCSTQSHLRILKSGTKKNLLHWYFRTIFVTAFSFTRHAITSQCFGRISANVITLMLIITQQVKSKEAY